MQDNSDSKPPFWYCCSFALIHFFLQLPCVLLPCVWSRLICTLIFNLLGQMRYRWNRHHSYIVNIVFLNTKLNFFFFRFSSSLNTKGTALGTVRCFEGCTVVARKEKLHRLCKRESKLPGPKTLKGKFWPFVQVKRTEQFMVLYLDCCMRKNQASYNPVFFSPCKNNRFYFTCKPYTEKFCS